MSIQPVSNAIPAVRFNEPPPSADQRAAQSPLGSNDSVQQTVSSEVNKPTATVTSVQDQKKVQETVKEAADKANRAIDTMKNSLQFQFSVDKDTGASVVKVVDTETKQTIRQIPSEEMLSIAHRLEEIKGLLIKNTA